MSTDSKIVGGIVTAGLAAGLAAVAAHSGWAFWPVFLLIPLVFAAIAAGSRSAGGSPPTEPGYGNYAEGGYWKDENPPAGMPIPVMLPGIEHEDPLPRMRLRSAVDGYDFRLSATVRWRESANVSSVVHHDLGAVARAEIVRRASDLVRTRDPDEVGVAETELARVLSARLSDATGLVEVWAGDVVLTLSDDDSERMRRLADIRKDEEVWERTRAYEKHRRAYLGDDVLKSTGSAVVWALSQQEDAIERAVGLIGPLALLSAAANDSDVAPVFRNLVAAQYTIAQNGHATETSHPTPDDEDYEYEAPDFEPTRNGASRTTNDYIDEFADHLGFPADSKHRGYFVSNFVNFLRSVDRSEEAESVQQSFYRSAGPAEPSSDVDQESAQQPDPPHPEPGRAAAAATGFETGAGPEAGPGAGFTDSADPFEP